MAKHCSIFCLATYAITYCLIIANLYYALFNDQGKHQSKPSRCSLGQVAFFHAQRKIFIRGSFSRATVFDAVRG